MSKKANPPPPVPSRGAVALLVLGLVESALSLFQWSQLLTLQAGGSTVCSVSEHVNCEVVWTTPFATQLHEMIGIPVAGLGLLWGVVVSVLAGLFLRWRSGGHTVRPAVNGLRLMAGVGVLSTGVFASVSASAGALCLTCLGTYVLVIAFAVVAWRGLPGPVLPLTGEWGRALLLTAGLLLAGFGILSIVGHAIPKSSGSEGLPQLSSEPPSIESYLRSLSPGEKQFAANALAQYRQETPQPAKAPARRRDGPVDAPVKIVEWTDPKCPHCKMLVEEMAAMKKSVPEGKMSLEARHYPLDGGCNPTISPEHTDGGLRCLAVKATICLENAPDYWELREKLFAAQATLTTDSVMRIASSGSTVNRSQLEACVNSADTSRRLQEDIDYAMQHHIEGTPLVVVNGREVMPSLPFLYALVMLGGDANAPAFKVLPPPNLSPMANSP